MKKLDKNQYFGKQFNLLTITSESWRQIIGNQERTVVNCTCRCGKKVNVQLQKLLCGHTMSCGCTKIGKRTHYKTDHPLYKVWEGLKYRCNKQNCNSYENYGGRGITVCTLWDEDFQSFYDWAISNGWTKGLQIDRINNNDSYYPENCRCVTPKENSRNRRTTKWVNINGENMVLAAAIEKKLIKKSLYYKNKSYRDTFTFHE